MQDNKQKLFNHMMKEHGIVLLESEIYDIRKLCFQLDKICNCLNLTIHENGCHLKVEDIIFNQSNHLNRKPCL